MMKPFAVLLGLLLYGQQLLAAAASADSLPTSFQHPPVEDCPMPLFWMNGTLSPAEIQSQLQGAREQSGFGGLAPLPLQGRLGDTLPKYLTADYFARYGDILNTARTLGMEVILYDDDSFPSGSAGGQMQKLYPQDTFKRLDRVVSVVSGPTNFSCALPPGAFLGAVALKPQTWQRIDLAASVRDGQLTWVAPAGTWKVMLFACVVTGDKLVDFMDPEAVDKCVALTYGEYFKRFPEHFGTTIRRDFFDDVGFYAKVRPWTTAFNGKFQKQNGFNPVTLYPALWEDIGPDTAAARVALFGFRGDLLAEGYPGRVSAWCRAHGIQSEGHPPGNYDPCAVDMHCDTFKFYRHVDIPLMDSIFFHGHGRPGFKLVSSAGTMYDRPLVAVEEYGAFAEESFDATMLYRNGMEMFARGVNRVIPHGMWLDPAHVKPPPLISHLSAKLQPALPGYSDWSARCSLLLQGGRPVVDIAMLYPIASLEAYYNFNLPDKMKWGKYIPPECDYQRVSDRLTCHVRRDFTFVHPDELAAQCTRQGAMLRLNNATNWQEYQVFILPGGKVIPWASLEKIKDFYDHGGKVIATTRLPDQSAEFGHDADVRAAIAAMFGTVPAYVPTRPTVVADANHRGVELPEIEYAATPFLTRTNDLGGRAYFAPQPTVAALQAMLDDALPVADVAFDPNLRVSSGDGALSYLHKQKDGCEIYFFANSSDDALDTFVQLRGNLAPELWNPHTGATAPAEYTRQVQSGRAVTRLHLKLPPVSSRFVVAPQI